MKFIEVDPDPLAGLTPAERRTLETAFEYCCLRDEHGKPTRYEFVVRADASGRAIARALPLVKRLRRMTRLPLPVPPQPADWRVWRHKVAGLSYDALAADDSPVLADLRRTRRSTPESRHQLALQAVRRVERFRGKCIAGCCLWWFHAIKRIVKD